MLKKGDTFTNKGKEYEVSSVRKGQVYIKIPYFNVIMNLPQDILEKHLAKGEK